MIVSYTLSDEVLWLLNKKFPKNKIKKHAMDFMNETHAH